MSWKIREEKPGQTETFLFFLFKWDKVLSGVIWVYQRHLIHPIKDFFNFSKYIWFHRGKKRNRSFALKVENNYVMCKKVSPVYLSVETDLSPPLNVNPMAVCGFFGKSCLSPLTEALDGTFSGAPRWVQSPNLLPVLPIRAALLLLPAFIRGWILAEGDKAQDSVSFLLWHFKLAVPVLRCQPKEIHTASVLHRVPVPQQHLAHAGGSMAIKTCEFSGYWHRQAKLWALGWWWPVPDCVCCGWDSFLLRKLRKV